MNILNLLSAVENQPDGHATAKGGQDAESVDALGGVDFSALLAVDLPISAESAPVEVTPADAAHVADENLVEVTLADAPASTVQAVEAATLPSGDLDHVTAALSPDPLEVMLQSWAGISTAIQAPADLAAEVEQTLSQAPAPQDSQPLGEAAPPDAAASGEIADLTQMADQPETIDMPTPESPPLVRPLPRETAGEVAARDMRTTKHIQPQEASAVTVGTDKKPETRVEAESTLPDDDLIKPAPAMTQKAEFAVQTPLAEPGSFQMTDSPEESLQTIATASTQPTRIMSTGVEWRPTQVNAPTMMRQILDAVVTMQDGRVEISLSPEELGRVRMVLSGREHAPHVVVWVERPEVLDQIRRNSALLTETFCESGLQNATFEFRDGSSERQNNLERGEAASRVSDSDFDSGSGAIVQHIVSLGSRIDGAPHIDIRM